MSSFFPQLSRALVCASVSLFSFLLLFKVVCARSLLVVFLPDRYWQTACHRLNPRYILTYVPWLQMVLLFSCFRPKYFYASLPYHFYFIYVSDYCTNTSPIIYLYFCQTNHCNYLIRKEQLQSIMEGHGIESHIFNELPYISSDYDKINDPYVS